MHDVTLTISLDQTIVAEHVPAVYIFEDHGRHWGAHLNIPLLDTAFLQAVVATQGAPMGIDRPNDYTVEVHGQSGGSIRTTGLISHMTPGAGGLQNVRMELNHETDDLDLVRRLVQ